MQQSLYNGIHTLTKSCNGLKAHEEGTGMTFPIIYTYLFFFGYL